MKIVKMETHMLSQKVSANETRKWLEMYYILEGKTRVRYISAVNDAISYLVVDK